MRNIERTTQFKRDYKRVAKQYHDIRKLLQDALSLLINDTELPARMKDHGLLGPWKGFRECHLRPDLLLIYEKVNVTLRLVRLGSHSDLFE